jgi:hypothetical protein
VKATVAERSGRRQHPSAGSAIRRASAARRAGPARSVAGRASLRLVAAEGRLLPQAPAEPIRTKPGPEAIEHEPLRPPEPAKPREPVKPPEPARPRQPSRTPVRLTRRGRLVVTTAAVLLIAAISVTLAGAAQALGGRSGAPAGPGAGITKIQVRPGQSLWSLAEAYDPNADTRQVIREILQLNSLVTDQVQPGQVLWMPRG